MSAAFTMRVKSEVVRAILSATKQERENAKMLGYRIEMWYRGGCVAVYDTIRASDLKKLQIPEDWHVSFAHHEKFKYRSPYSKKDAVKY